MASQKMQFGLLFFSASLSLCSFAQDEQQSISGHLVYGRHSQFWREVESLQKSEDPSAQVDRFFDEKNYGSREGVVMADTIFSSVAPDPVDGVFNRSEAQFGFHALVGGEAYNRISPKLRGYGLWDFSFAGRLYRSPPVFESGLLLLLGSEFGLGRQKLIQGDAAEFMNKVPLHESTLFYTGLDLGLGYESRWSEYMRFTYAAYFFPTHFYSEHDRKDFEYGVKKNATTLRWRTEFENEFSLQAEKEGGISLGSHLYTGQQPVPVRLLPRSWDAVHSLEPVPVMASLLGAGLNLNFFNASRRVLFESYGGFYGGYWGGGAALRVYFIRLEVGSFGLEQTSGYRIRESRMEYAGLGLRYDW